MPTRDRNSESSVSSADASSPQSGIYICEKEAGHLKSYDEEDLYSPVEKSHSKRKRAKFIRKVNCQVCDDVANDHIHYGAIACYSCRAFFRRGVNSNANYFCSLEKRCVITKNTRKHCQYCRFQKCKNVGMKSSWVMTEEDKKDKKLKAEIKRIKTHSQQQQRASKHFKKYRRSSVKRADYYSDSLSPNHHDYKDVERRPDKERLNYNPITPDVYDERPVYGCRPSTEPRYEYYPNAIKNEPSIPPPHFPSFEIDRIPSQYGQQHQYGKIFGEAHKKQESSSSSSEPLSSFSFMTNTYTNIESIEVLQSEPYSLDNINFSSVENDYKNAQCSKSTSDISDGLESKATENSTLEELLIKFTSPMDLSQCNGCSSPSLSNIPRRVLPWTELQNFSEFEGHIICNIINIEDEASKAIPLRMETMTAMINSCHRRIPLPSEVCLEGYLVCMRRIIYLASKLDFFASFCIEDQKALLLANTDMIVNIRTARFFQPGRNLGKQLAVAAGESEIIGDETQDVRLHYTQIFNSPWAYTYEHERLYHELLRKILDLELDEISTVIISMMSLFSTTNVTLKEKARAIRTQEFFTELLKKYVSRKMSEDSVSKVLPKYILILSNLEEMARIIVSNRLNL